MVVGVDQEAEEEGEEGNFVRVPTSHPFHFILFFSLIREGCMSGSHNYGSLLPSA